VLWFHLLSKIIIFSSVKNNYSDYSQPSHKVKQKSNTTQFPFNKPPQQGKMQNTVTNLRLKRFPTPKYLFLPVICAGGL